MVTLSSILPPVNVTTVSGTLAVTNGGTGVTTSTGTGSVVLSNSPTLVTPVLGAASATSVTAALGSVTAPSFTFTGDTNTGIWSPAADTIAFSEGGVEAMRINSAGDVGIGTASPNSAGVNRAITVNGTSNSIVEVNYGGTRGAYLFSNASGTVLSSVQNLRLQLNTNDTPRVTIDSSGNVGVGTDTPTRKLSVVGAGNTYINVNSGNDTSVAGILFGGTTNPSNGQVVYDNSANSMTFVVGGSGRAVINGSGNVGIGTSSPASRFTVNSGAAGVVSNFTDGVAQGLALVTGTGYFGFYNPNYGAITFRDGSNGAENVRITDSGNVGIGTSSPSAKVEAQGNNVLYSLKYASDGGSALIAWKNSSGTTLWDIGGGVATAQDELAFRRQGSTVMLLNASGNVGIGTSSPITRLTVDGGAASLRTGNQFRFYPTANNNYSQIYNPTGGQMAFDSGAGEAMRIDGSGNVGIGTSSPNALLALSGAAAAGGILTRITNTNATGFSSVNFGDSTETRGQIWVGNLSYASFGGAGSMNYSANSGPHVWYTNYAERMRIDSSGNVGIGTSSPTARLDVAVGNIRLSNNQGLEWGGGNNFIYGNETTDIVAIATNNVERMRIDSSGNLLVGVSSGGSHIFSKNAGNSTGTTNIFEVQNAGSDVVAIFLSATSYGTSNSAGTALRLGRSSTTSRSINAGGTINASGADYAEYMVKAGDFSIEKGEVCGINSDGLLTKDFSEAISFAVKSTDPAYVGGDVWGAGCGDDPDALELARQTVDRIAFAGQVPVNVYNAVPGQYIIPVDAGGSIGAEAVSNPTFEQYQLAVGKVIAIEQDGRAKIIVKIA